MSLTDLIDIIQCYSHLEVFWLFIMDLVGKSVKPVSVRGGSGNFDWENVKSDKYRENYLGCSLMAPVGRWQKGKDITWYAKGKRGTNESTTADSALEEERKRLKVAEQEAMAAALGVPVEVLLKSDNRKRKKERSDSRHGRRRRERSRDNHGRHRNRERKRPEDRRSEREYRDRGRHDESVYRNGSRSREYSREKSRNGEIYRHKEYSRDRSRDICRDRSNNL